MKRTFLPLIVLAVFILILSGCSADGPETGSSDSGKESADPSENTDLSSDDSPDSDPEPSGAAARATIMPGEHR